MVLRYLLSTRKTTALFCIHQRPDSVRPHIHFSPGILSILENQLMFYISSGFQETKALRIAESALNNSAPTTFCANWEHPRYHIGNICGIRQKKSMPPPPPLPPLHVQLSHWLHANLIYKFTWCVRACVRASVRPT
jgi:hypothetical protein